MKSRNINGLHKDVPYWDKVVDDGEISVASIFQFKGGLIEIFPFLYECKEHNCGVTFENENIHINKEGASTEEDMLIGIYSIFAQDSTICKHYIDYLCKVNNGMISENEPDFIAMKEGV